MKMKMWREEKDRQNIIQIIIDDEYMHKQRPLNENMLKMMDDDQRFGMLQDGVHWFLGLQMPESEK